MSKFHPLKLAAVERETRDAIALTFDVPPALARAVPLRRRPAPHRAREDRRAGRPPLVLDLLAGARGEAPDRGEAQSGRRVLDLGQRQPRRRRVARRHAANGPLRRRAGPGSRASLRRLRGRQRYHAARLDHRDDARERADVRIHALLRQSRVGHRHVPRGTGRAQGHLPRAVQPRARAVARGAGHSAPPRPHRP